MNRRKFLAIGAAAAVGTDAWAQQCGVIAPNVSRCVSQVDLSRIYSTSQKKSQWCWAASTSMIFAQAGYDLSQETIVQSVYGDLSNQPAYSTTQMGSLLSRTWISDSGRRFRAKITAAYDHYMGDTSMNNYVMRSELDAGRPLFFCNRSHAMVLTAFVYDVGPGGMVGINIGLVDPWPGNGPRGPTSQEMLPASSGGDITYVAAVTVTPA